MKRYKNLEAQILSYDNIIGGFEDTVRKMRYKPPMLWLYNHMEEVLIETFDSLRDRSWQPKGFREFMIREPKLRMISAPYVTDRLVHHILCRVIEPLLDRRFMYDSYACRKGKGTLAACKRVQHHLRALGEDAEVYVYRIDIRKYFHSVDHDVLKGIIRKHFADDFVLWLTDTIIDSYPRGLPIGSLTSQLFANVVLDQLDHHLECPSYVRYMDDVVIVSTDLDELKALQRKAETYIEDTLKLRLNERKTHISKYQKHINFAGYLITPWVLYPRKANIKAAGKRLRKLAIVNPEKWDASKQSFLGYMKHCAWTKDASRVMISA